MESIGVKESGEVINAIFDLGEAVIVAAKDGVQVTDVVALLADEKVKASFVAAFEGISKVPAEMGDITLSEGLELGMLALKRIPGLLAVMKK